MLKIVKLKISKLVSIVDCTKVEKVIGKTNYNFIKN
jgi:hypothetical protein